MTRTRTDLKNGKCDEKKKNSNFFIPHVFINNNVIPTYPMFNISTACTVSTSGLPGTATPSSGGNSLGSRPGSGITTLNPYQSLTPIYCRTSADTETDNRTSKLCHVTVPLHGYLEGVELILHRDDGVMQGSSCEYYQYLVLPPIHMSDPQLRETKSPAGPAWRKVKGESGSVDLISVMRERASKSVASTVNRSVEVQMSASAVDKLIADLRKRSIDEDSEPEINQLVCDDCPYKFTSYSRTLLDQHMETVHEGVKMKTSIKKKAKRKVGPVSSKSKPKVQKVENDQSVMVLSQPSLTSTQVEVGTNDETKEEDSQNLLETSRNEPDPLGDDDKDDDNQEDVYDFDDYSQMESEQEDHNHSVNRIVLKNETVAQEAIENDDKVQIATLQARVVTLEKAVTNLKTANENNMKVRKKEITKYIEEKKEMIGAHRREVSKLLDENKKLHEKNVEQKEALKNEFERSRAKQRWRDERETEESVKREKEKERRARTRCRNVDNREGCKKSRCEFFHPVDHCQKFLEGASCLSHLCKKLHREDERQRLRSIRNERKRPRSEYSPPARSNKQKSESGRKPGQERICRDWTRSGRCRSFSTGSLGCRDGLHPQVKDFTNRVTRRAATKGSPGGWAKGTSR